MSINQIQSSENPVSQYCIKAADYIQANYQSHITIDGIAKNLGIDRRYFSRIFTKYIGVSPQKYLVDYRLEKAKMLMSTGAYSVSEVAASVGYDDIFAFSKIFKKKYGVPPSKCNVRLD
jgi:AraC-like DNA-binding protein